LPHGLSPDHQRWIHTSHPLFLVPAPSLRIAFRAKFLDGLAHLYNKGLLDCRGTASAFKDPDVFAATKTAYPDPYGAFSLVCSSARPTCGECSNSRGTSSLSDSEELSTDPCDRGFSIDFRKALFDSRVRSF
jgi:hypothetical protein